VVAPRHPFAVGLALALILAGLVGFLVGQGNARQPPPEKPLTASSDGVLVDYPFGWAPEHARSIPGLVLERPVALAPSDAKGEAGLIAGRLSSSEPGPVPGSLIPLLQGVPQTEVVDLLGYQAYRYRHMRLAGFAREVTLYAIPNTSGPGVALACFAARGASAEMSSCERIAGTLTVTEQSQSYDLAPEPALAHTLSMAMGKLDAARTRLRATMASNASFASLELHARELAGAFSRAAASLAPLEPPPTAGAAKAALIAALQQAQSAYAALAAAANAQESAPLAEARARVYKSELAVDYALEGFALLGYGRA
jgi:hypothetical protein